MTFSTKSFCTSLPLACALIGAMGFTACGHNQQLLDDHSGPDKTSSPVVIPSAAKVSATQNYSPEMKRKVAEAEQLKKLQVQVYELQDLVYGNAEYGSMGLYGALRECKVANGAGSSWNEPMDRVADKESRLLALDNPSELEKITEASLLERQQRFVGYRAALRKHQDEFEDKIEICRGELKARKGSENVPASGVSHEHVPDTQEAL